MKNFSKIVVLELIIILNLFLVIPTLVIFRNLVLENFVWENVKYIYLVSLVYAAILLFTLLIQLLTKRPYFDVIMGCHQMYERSFKRLYRLIPICARCLGIVIGIISMIFISQLPINHNYLLFGLIPLIVDGICQIRCIYTSNNIRRLVTGIIFGWALCVLAGYFYLYSVKFYVFLSELVLKLFKI